MKPFASIRFTGAGALFYEFCLIITPYSGKMALFFRHISKKRSKSLEVIYIDFKFFKIYTITIVMKTDQGYITVNTNILKGVFYMKTVKISLNSIDAVKSFVNTVTKFDSDFDLVSGRYVIDAKSIMGIFSLDLSKPIDLNIHAEDNTDAILDVLKPYIIG